MKDFIQENAKRIALAVLTLVIAVTVVSLIPEDASPSNNNEGTKVENNQNNDDKDDANVDSDDNNQNVENKDDTNADSNQNTQVEVDKEEMQKSTV